MTLSCRHIVAALLLLTSSPCSSWAQYSDGRPVKTRPWAYRTMYALGRYATLYAPSGIGGSAARRLHALGEGVGSSWGFYLDRRGRFVLNIDVGTSFASSIPVELFSGAERDGSDYYEQNTFRFQAATFRGGLAIGRIFSFAHGAVSVAPMVGLSGSGHYWGRGQVTTRSSQGQYTQPVAIFRQSPWFLPSARTGNVGIDGGLMVVWSDIMMAMHYNYDLLSIVPHQFRPLRAQDLCLSIGYNF